MKLRKQIKAIEKLDVKDIKYLDYRSGRLLIAVEERTFYKFAIQLQQPTIEGLFGKAIADKLIKGKRISSSEVIEAIFCKELILELLQARLVMANPSKDKELGIPKGCWVKEASQDPDTLLWLVCLGEGSDVLSVVTEAASFREGLAEVILLSKSMAREEQ